MKSSQVEDEVVGTVLTGSLAKTEAKARRTVEADLSERVDIGFVDGASSQVVLDACSKYLQFVLLGSNVSVDPVLCLEVVFVVA